MKLGQNFVKYLVRLLGNGISRKNAFEIYWSILNWLKYVLKIFGPVKKIWTCQKDLDLSKIILDQQKSRAWVPYLQNPVYGPITLVLNSEIKECMHGNLHFEHDELLAFYRRFFLLFFKVSNYELFLQTFKVQKVWVQMANLLKYHTINHTLHQFLYVKHFFSKNGLNNIYFQK